LLGLFLFDTAEFSWGNYDVTQQQTWWAVRVGDSPVSFAGLDDIERATTVGHRWWTPDDLASAGQTYAGGLVEQMRTAVALALGPAGPPHRHQFRPAKVHVLE
jgi:hypothetical protein